MNCSGITGVAFPSSVTTIGNGAFYGCTGINTTITLPNTVTALGTEAFRNCSSLPELVYNMVTNSVSCTTTTAPFMGCTSLATVTIGEDVTNVQKYTFYNLSNITTVNFNAIACDVMGWATASQFNDSRSKLATVNIGSRVRKIPDYAFYACSTFTSLTIPDTVISIGLKAFMNCSGITGALTLPDTLNTMGNDCFNGCTKITSLNTGNGLTAIPQNAFYGCTGLTSVTIGESVTTIATEAFRNAKAITTVVWNAINCTQAYYYND